MTKLCAFHSYVGRPGVDGEAGRDGPKGKRGEIIEIGEKIDPEKGDVGDVGYPGLQGEYQLNQIDLFLLIPHIQYLCLRTNRIDYL